MYIRPGNRPDDVRLSLRLRDVRLRQNVCRMNKMKMMIKMLARNDHRSSDELLMRRVTVHTERNYSRTRCMDAGWDRVECMSQHRVGTGLG